MALTFFQPIGLGRAMGLAEAREHPLVIAERETLGIDHAVAGAVLCKHWKLRSELIDSVRHHHFFEHTESVPMGLQRTVHVANLSGLATRVLTGETPELKQQLYERANTLFALGQPAVDQILGEVPGLVRSAQPSGCL